MKRVRGLIYGFNYLQEYEEYKKICSKKNVSYSYTDWYGKILKKYDCYEIRRLCDFEKYLNELANRENRRLEMISFCEGIGSYLISVSLTILALFVALVTYFDSLQSTLDETMLQKVTQTSVSSGDFQMAAEQLQHRADIFSRTTVLFGYTGYIAIFYILIMAVLYCFKMYFRERALFLKEYGKCILNIKEEKLCGLQEKRSLNY